ncbi:MAG: OmpA family protein, partial [Bacteroidota bacterium]
TTTTTNIVSNNNNINNNTSNSSNTTSGSTTPTYNNTTRVASDVAASDLDVLEQVMRDIKFESGGARVRTYLKPLLADVAEVMRDYPDHHLRISGHTDNEGDSAENLELSQKRAASCFKHVVRNGISPSRIDYQGYGDTRPVASNDTEEGRRKNRRVEFELFRP